ncbi:MAG: hypothetical protein Q8K86_02025 [Candidatus Nanopelagicaceae bacterium]|nr:hypothetical protein [Candidatus Nanopelagicaceae bacterium]
MINTLSQPRTLHLRTSIAKPIAGLTMLASAILGVAFGSTLANALTSEDLTTIAKPSIQVLRISEDSFHKGLATISPKSNLHGPLVDLDSQKVHV